jgi:hypothetical protein
MRSVCGAGRQGGRSRFRTRGNGSIARLWHSPLPRKPRARAVSRRQTPRAPLSHPDCCADGRRRLGAGGAAASRHAESAGAVWLYCGRAAAPWPQRRRAGGGTRTRCAEEGPWRVEQVSAARVLRRHLPRALTLPLCTEPASAFAAAAAPAEHTPAETEEAPAAAAAAEEAPVAARTRNSPLRLAAVAHGQEGDAEEELVRAVEKTGVPPTPSAASAACSAMASGRGAAADGRRSTRYSPPSSAVTLYCRLCCH